MVWPSQFQGTAEDNGRQQLSRPCGTHRDLARFPGDKSPGYCQLFLRNRPKSSFPSSSGFVAGSVHLAMMAAAQWDDEFVAHLAPEGPMLREPKVMRIHRLAPTD